MTNRINADTILITTLKTIMIDRGITMFDVNQLLDEAIRETVNLNIDEIFLVKDLFKGYFWKRIPHGDRLLLGILFLNYVKKIKGDIQIIEKTSSNQQRYRKIKIE